MVVQPKRSLFGILSFTYSIFKRVVLHHILLPIANNFVCLKWLDMGKGESFEKKKNLAAAVALGKGTHLIEYGQVKLAPLSR